MNASSALQYNAMKTAPSSSLSREISPPELVEENARLHEQVQRLKRELDWFKKQVFGPSSEKQPFEVPGQNRLFEHDETASSQPAEEKRTVNAYQRGTGKKQRDEDCLNDTGLRFGPEPAGGADGPAGRSVRDYRYTHHLAPWPAAVELRGAAP